MKFGIDGLSSLIKTIFMFGKKNKTSLMVGGSLTLSWTSLILMMFEAPKAAKKVQEENEQRHEDDLQPMSKTEVAIEYAKTCAPSFLCQGGSTALGIIAQKENLENIGQVVLLSQLYKDEAEKLKRQIRKEENGEQKLLDYYDQDYTDTHPVKEIIECPEYRNIGQNETLVDDENTDTKRTMTMIQLREGFAEFNQLMSDRYLDAYRKKYGEELKDAFFNSSDNPYPVIDGNIYVTGTLDEFLACIGFRKKNGRPSSTGRNLKFHYYGTGPAVDFNKVVDFRSFTDEESGKVAYARIRNLDELEYLYASDDVISNTDWKPSYKKY